MRFSLFLLPLALFADLTYPIEFFQERISPIDGVRSHYRPSSSQYTKEAIRRYGLPWGVIMGCDRLMRENSDEWLYPPIDEPPFRFKYDPVR